MSKPVLFKNILLIAIGGALLVIGTTLVLKDWMYVLAFVRGIAGMILAIGGLVVLMFVKDRA